MDERHHAIFGHAMLERDAQGLQLGSDVAASLGLFIR